MTAIAKVLKSNGSDGGLIIGFRGVEPEDIDLKRPVFIDFDGLPVPFYFESFTPKGSSKALVRLTGIRTLKDAEELAGREICAEDGPFEEEEDDLNGWTILDARGERVGVITGDEPIPGNPCVYVDTGEKEVLVPLSEDLILAVDEDNEIIRMDLPEGLL